MMGKTKSILLFVATVSFAFTAFAAGEASSSWNPRTPLQYKSSFHSLLTSSQDNEVKTHYSKQCLQAITHFLKKGNNFDSAVMVQKYSLPMEQVPLDEVKDKEFFHYTPEQDVLSAIQTHQYEEIFSYIRSLGNSQSWFFYAAADPISSQSYGPIQIKIYFRPQALMFFDGGRVPGPHFNEDHDTTSEIENELIKKDPALEACRGKKDSQALQDHSILVILAAEASHIDAIAYLGFDDAKLEGHGELEQWVQVVGPWSILNATGKDSRD